MKDVTAPVRRVTWSEPTARVRQPGWSAPTDGGQTGRRMAALRYALPIFFHEGPSASRGRDLPPRGAVLNVRANSGLFGVLASRVAAEVVAFEPDLSARRPPERDLKLNGASGVTVVPTETGSASGGGELHNPGGIGTASLVPAEKGEAHHNSSGVPVMTMDGVVQGSVDFIRLEIEGTEPLALREAVGTIRRYRPRPSLCTSHEPTHLPRLRQPVIEGDERPGLEQTPVKLHAYAPGEDS